MSTSSSPSAKQLSLLASLAEYAAEEASFSAFAFPFFVVEAILWGVYAVLTVIALTGFLRKRKRGAFKTWSTYLSMLMFLLATTHLGISIRAVHVGEVRAQAAQTRVDDCLRQLIDGINPLSAACGEPALFSNDISMSDVVAQYFQFELPLVNVAISDAIVSWRACILWRRQRVVHGLSVLLCLGTLAALVYGGIGGQGPGLPGSILSWVTNLWSTSLISWKAWQHRRVMKEALGNDTKRTKAERVLLLFVESGLLYAIVWTFIMISNCIFAASPGQQWNSGTVDLVNVFDGIVYYPLIQLVSIYPMAIVVLTEFTDSYYERAVTVAAARVHYDPPPRRQPSPDILDMTDLAVEDDSSAFGSTIAIDAEKGPSDRSLGALQHSRGVESHEHPNPHSYSPIHQRP
ncbi:hypothetical protein PsYK624_032980 [Phanerochaete sordida]|uniref:Uncharacterized protein n=1 Tax=Phanerochaete sordida TaxID=48140 RepID=A0A9P3G3I7_9APHY|nr:hypothetical protein PsYK624_032980 [Phanerochaete sordida]